MLEIIGWLGCVYLFVKGLQIIGDQSNRVQWEEGHTRLSVASACAAGIAILSALIFPFVLHSQVSSLSGPSTTAETSVAMPGSNLTAAEVDCINNAGSDNQKILNCTN